MKQSFRACRDVVWSWGNPDLLIGLSRERAQEVVVRLAKRGMHPRSLIRRIIYSPHADHLLPVLAEQCRKGGGVRVEQFVMGLLRVKPERWNDAFDPAVAGTLLSEADAAQIVLARQPSILAEEQHPLREFFSADAYWKERVRKFVAREDFERAWDELRRAWHGVGVHASRGEGTVLVNVGRASSRAIGELALEIARGLAEQGVFQPLADLPLEITLAPAEIAASVRFKMAQPFILEATLYSDSSIRRFSYEGAAIIWIGRAMSERRNARRRVRRAAAKK